MKPATKVIKNIEYRTEMTSEDRKYILEENIQTQVTLAEKLKVEFGDDFDMSEKNEKGSYRTYIHYSVPVIEDTPEFHQRFHRIACTHIESGKKRLRAIMEKEEQARQERMERRKQSCKTCGREFDN